MQDQVKLDDVAMNEAVTTKPKFDYAAFSEQFPAGEYPQENDPATQMSIDRARQIIEGFKNQIDSEKPSDLQKAIFNDDVVEAAMYTQQQSPGDYVILCELVKKVCKDMAFWKKTCERRLSEMTPGWQQRKAQPTVESKMELTELGAAIEFMRVHGDNFRYVKEAKSWAAWDGRCWQLDSNRAFMRKLRGLATAYLNQGMNTEIPDDERKEKLKHGVILCKAQTQINVADKLAPTIEGAEVKMDMFDAASSAGYLNCRNGKVNLQTGELTPHDRSDYATIMIDIDYNPDAECSTWIKGLNKIFQMKPHMIDYFQQLVGYTATGTTREKIVVIGYGGEGNNGKTKLMTTLQEVLGPYADTVPTESLMAKKWGGSTTGNEFAPLRTVRFLPTSEVERGEKMATNLVKRLSGQDAIKVRFLFKDFFSMLPRFTIWLMCNDRPLAPADDQAFWNRIHVIPFDTIFWTPTSSGNGYKDLTENGETADDEAQPGKKEYVADLKISEKWSAEKEGILAWIVEGAKKWYASGGIRKPDEVIEASREYQQSMDTITGFVQECCDRNDVFSARGADVNAAYVAYCKESGREPLKTDDFKKQMIKLFDGEFSCKRVTKGIYWYGFKLLNQPIDA